MKKSIFLVVLLLISISFYAQAPEKVNYQAVARNLTGAPLINQTINVKYEVRQGSSTGTVVYAENHVITTNQFGLFTAEIGGGTVITGSFPGIAWGTSPFYLYVEVDGDPMGVTQLLSVPYALYAKESGNGPAGLPGKNSLSVSSTYSGPMCSANGGSQIDVGLDDNNDDILQPIEIDFTYYVCNGTNGIVGSNGLNTLSSTVVSTTCPNGGVTVNMGLDANNNSVLDASEITVSYDVCNGANGLPGASGTNGLNSLAQTIPSTSCPNGGVTVNMGLDLNINGTLEVGEITTTYDVCNGVDGTSGTTYFAGNGISLSGDTITNTGDADADATNELQVLSFSNDTLYLSNGNSVYITPSAADNWGTDVVNTSGTNISGNGTVGSPLTVTETTTTLVDNGNGTFTYTDETGTPITFDANIDDADADSTNELQLLSISGDTLFLSNGNQVILPAGAADNWGTDVVNTSGTNISGDGTAGNPLIVTETTTTLVDNGNGTFTYTDETGTPITFDANIDDADADATNELQVLSFSNDTLYLSNGNSVYITPGAGDNWGTDVVNTSGTNISGNGTVGSPLTVTETTTTLVDNGNGTFTYTDETGTPITFDANIDDADADSTNELQLLSISGDTLFLSNGNQVILPAGAADNWGTDVVNTSGTNISGDGTAGNPLIVTETTTTLVDNGNGTFTYTDETGTPITFDANIDDADADSTNELQLLSISGDTLFLSNGNQVILPAGAADNWGTDVVNTSGTNISGDGTAGNPLIVTETTTTLVDNGNGTFTYTDETGTPITFDANIDDADADATNELQVLSFSNDTLYLSNGNSVYITPGAGDNWGTDVVNTSGTNISGNGTVGSPLTVTETTTTLVDNGNGTFTYTDETGTPITFDANIDDADADATNELQVLSFSNDTLYLSNGNSVYITPGAGDNWGTDVVNTSGTNISGNGTVGSPLTVTETTTTLVDNGNGTFTYTDETGTPITFDANIDDADADATNELQVLSFSNDTLYLSNGNSVYITPGAGDNWGTDVVNTSGTNISGNGTVGSPLTVTETTTTLVDNGNGTFTYTDETGTPITFDANIDDADADATNELQVLSFSNDTLYLSNGNSVYITPGAGDNWGTDVVNTSGTNISGNGTVGSPLTVTETTTTLVDNGNGTFTYTDETGTPITFDANIDDADADATNELQVLSFSNDTLYLSNGNSVYITPGAGDNWGSQTVNVDGTTITGDGVVTPLSGFDGQYSSLTGTPIDNDTSATNEIQVLSFSNDTLYLSNGNSVYITPGDTTNIYNSDGTLTGVRTVTQNANNITYIGGGINPTAIFRNGNVLGAKIQIDATNAGASPSVNLSNNGTNWGGISGTANGLQLNGGTGGNVGIGVSPANGRFVLQHAATQAYPTIKLNQIDLNLNRIHFTNTPVANNKFWEIAAETDNNDNDAGYSINYFDGSTYNIHFLTYGNGQTAINGSGLVPGPNYSMFDVFGTSSIRDSLSIRTLHGNGYTFPVVDGAANYLMQTDGSGNLSWVDPSSLGNSGWSLTGNTGTGASNFIGTTDAQDLRFRTNNTEKMVITQSGNVGMGVAAPLAHLHISRDGNAVAGIMSAGGYGELTLLRSNGTKASPSFVLTNDQIGTLDFVGYNSVQGWTGGLAASIEVFATEDYSASGFKGSKMAFNVSQNGGAGTLQAMTIDNFGRIGIGVTSPLQLVDIEGGENSGIDLTTGAIKLRSSVNSIAGAQFGTVSSHSLDFITSNNSRIRIASSGEVGVGTTSPTAVLHLEGSLRLNNLSGSAPIAGYILTSIDAQGNAEWTDPSLLTISSPWTKTSNYVYPTTLSDSIGIGTNFPAQKLHVADGQILNNWSNPNGDANLVIRNWNSGSGPGYNTGTLGQVTIATSDAAENKYAIQGYSGGDGGSKYGFYGSASGTGGQNYGGYFSALQGTNNTGVSSIAYADFTSNSNAYGLYTTAQGDGAGTTYGIYAQNASTVTGNTYAGYFQNLNSTGSTIYGVRTDVTGNLGIGEKYGINSSVTGSALFNYAGYFSASGATNNWAGYFAQGNVHISNDLRIGTTGGTSKLTVNGEVALNDGATVATNNAVTILLTNSGPAVNAGDIVVVGTANNSFNVTNNPGNYSVIGVVTENIGAGAVGKIAISGVVTVNIESASNVLRGQHCITGSNNGRASGVSIPSAGTSIGVYLTDGPADGTAKVLLR